MKLVERHFNYNLQLESPPQVQRTYVFSDYGLVWTLTQFSQEVSNLLRLSKLHEPY